MMAEHKCFISFKTEDTDYKEFIQNKLDVDMIDKSLDEPIHSMDEDYVMRVIRRDHLQDSTVTIVLIGTHSAEFTSGENQGYIKRELQASLYDTPNGILGVALPEMYSSIFQGITVIDGQKVSIDRIDNWTTIREFNYNFYLPDPQNPKYWQEDDRYCTLVKWDDFKTDPNAYIQQAYDKRTSTAADKIRVFPKN